MSATEAEFEELAEVWEASVRATHHFLQNEDFELIKSLIVSDFLPAVRLYRVRDAQGQVQGFLGVSDEQIEMLFIRPDCRGAGIGKLLLRFAIDSLGLGKVDVNEQNDQAVGFYRHMGFRVIGRSETDSMNKPYPILHLSLA
jgi:putative acetyltransferase